MAKTILIVDDDYDFLAANKTMLEANGYRTETAGSAAEGIEKSKTAKPDLIVLDTIMPQLNGLQVLRYLRQHYTIPVLMIPGESEADLLSKALISGAESYLIKPLNMKDLSAFVRRKLNLPAMDMAGSG